VEFGKTPPKVKCHQCHRFCKNFKHLAKAIKMSALGKRKFAFISALLLTCVTATAAAFCQMNEMNQTSFGVVVVGTQVAHTPKLGIFSIFS
jgi:hypothetical protein